MHTPVTDDGGSGFPEYYDRHDHYHSDSEVVGVVSRPFSDRLSVSGPLDERGGRKGNIPDGAPESSSGGGKSDDYVEITLDVRDDPVMVHSVKMVDVDDPELTLLEKRSPVGSPVEQNASEGIREVSEELKRLTSFSKRQPVNRLDRNESAAAYALRGLKFVSKNESWATVEKRFDDLTNETKGFLPRSLFAECIGMSRDSKEFAGELLDSLSRRRNITGDSINKAQLKDFWDQIADQSFDSRLQTFFDMIDKDGDGRITEDEVKEIISLSASANKLSRIKELADEYAALIMEELDPDNAGYFTIETLEMLLLQAPTLVVRGESQNFSHDEYDSDTEDPELTLFAKGLEKRSSSVLSVVRNASARIRHVSECSRFYSASKRFLEGRLDRTSSAAAHAFMGLQFISQDDDNASNKISKGQVRETRMNLPAPIPLYARERLVRAFRYGIPVTILKVVIYPGNVLALYMSKPVGFNYKSGQYMLLKCAAVSTFEWHPFYITAAPNDYYLSVHIRTLGDWTRRIKTLFAQVCEPPRNGQDGLLRADYVRFQADYPKFPRILIDGPYSGAAQNYEKYEVVLLVGLGIGATPMMSIARHIMNTQEEDVTFQKNISAGTRRAYLYWVTREQGSFDWFKDVINQVAEMEEDAAVVEMHNYCVSVYQEGDARSAIIAMIQSLNHAKNGFDPVSGTRVKCHFGRPNWRDVYKRIALNHTGSRIGVFYCGASALVKELKQLALDFSNKTSTKFDFHKVKF